MHLTRFTDNALRCLMLLGLEPARCVSVPEVARRMNVSYDHLVKIVQRLTALGYIATERGRHGGVRLAMRPADINIGTLVRHTGDNLTLVECFNTDHQECPIASACKLAGVLEQALAAFFKVLDGRALEDVLRPKRELLRLTTQVNAS